MKWGEFVSFKFKHEVDTHNQFITLFKIHFDFHEITLETFKKEISYDYETKNFCSANACFFLFFLIKKIIPHFVLFIRFLHTVQPTAFLFSIFFDALSTYGIPAIEVIQILLRSKLQKRYGFSANH
jgi:hypothetical protein